MIFFFYLVFFSFSILFHASFFFSETTLVLCFYALLDFVSTLVFFSLPSCFCFLPSCFVPLPHVVYLQNISLWQLSCSSKCNLGATVRNFEEISGFPWNVPEFVLFSGFTKKSNDFSYFHRFSWNPLYLLKLMDLSNMFLNCIRFCFYSTDQESSENRSWNLRHVLNFLLNSTIYCISMWF